MIARVYISHDQMDEGLALELSGALKRVGLDTYVATYSLAPGISRAERVSHALRNSDCLVPLLTASETSSVTVNQELGFARGIDLLVIPLLEERADLPFLIEHLKPVRFTRREFPKAIGTVIRTVRDLSNLDWLKVTCPKCGEEMTQYLTPQDEVDDALKKGTHLETICSYCQNRIFLDPRTFAPLL